MTRLEAPGRTMPPSRDDLLAGQVQKARQAFIGAARPVTDAELAAVQAAAQARAAEPEGLKPLAAALPAAAGAASEGLRRVLNPKICDADVERFKRPRFETKPWFGAVHRAAAGREKGDVLRPTIERVASVLSWLCRDGKGKVQVSFAELAHQVGACVETVRKAVRWLEDGHLIDTFNVRTRVDRKWWNASNLYLLVMPDDVPVAEPAGPAPAEPPQGALDVSAFTLRQVARMTARLERWAPAFGMFARAIGLNTTPLAPRQKRPEADPAPA